MTRKEKFERFWDSRWFTSSGDLKNGTLAYSSWSVQSLFILSYMAIDGMEDALTLPEKEYLC